MDKNKKKGRYERIYKQLEQLVGKSDNQISHMATVVAVLHHKMEYFFLEEDLGWRNILRILDYRIFN